MRGHHGTPTPRPPQSPQPLRRCWRASARTHRLSQVCPPHGSHCHLRHATATTTTNAIASLGGRVARAAEVGRVEAGGGGGNMGSALTQMMWTRKRRRRNLDAVRKTRSVAGRGSTAAMGATRGHGHARHGDGARGTGEGADSTLDGHGSGTCWEAAAGAHGLTCTLVCAMAADFFLSPPPTQFLLLFFLSLCAQICHVGRKPQVSREGAPSHVQ